MAGWIRAWITLWHRQDGLGAVPDRDSDEEQMRIEPSSVRAARERGVTVETVLAWLGAHARRAGRADRAPGGQGQKARPGPEGPRGGLRPRGVARRSGRPTPANAACLADALDELIEMAPADAAVEGGTLPPANSP